MKEKTMKKLVVTFLVYSLTQFSSMALAQDSSADRVNYFGVTFGDVRPLGLESDDKTLPPNRVSLSDLDLSRAWLLGIRFGHMPERLHKMGAIEVEAFMTTESDVKDEYYFWYPYTTSDVLASVDISVKAIMVNFLLKRSFGVVRPYGGFGLGWAWFEMDGELSVPAGYQWPNGTDTYDLHHLNDDTFGGQLLLGLEFTMTEALFLDLGYRYFYAQPEFESGTEFDVKMTYKANLFTASLRYTF
jgi:opacity protein-like surface antigen